MKNGPTHDFDAFIRSCNSIREKVIVFKGAQNDAKEIFQLHTKHEILDFISNGGLERRKFINTKPWENNPNPNEPIFVDDYNFWSFSKHCYIAIMFNHKGGKWIIKSLHLEPSSPTIGDIVNNLKQRKTK